MAINHVDLSTDAYMVCLAHALSTEKEEIMGLLIGEIDETRVCQISAVMMLRRSDKRPDRVEISPEQLSAASTHAEQLAIELNRPMRVVGWYHSHPHITVWPSHVDVQTQAMYQMMDEGFVGLIFSVFNQDKITKLNRIQVICFQSVNQAPEGEPPQNMKIEIPLHLKPTPYSGISKPNLSALVELPQILSQEEEEAYQRTLDVPDMDLISQVHNGAVYTKSLCHIMEVMSGPLMQSLEHRLARNEQDIADLRQAKEAFLEQRLSSAREAPPSPHKQTSV